MAIRLSLRGSRPNPVIILGDVFGHTGCRALVCCCTNNHCTSFKVLISLAITMLLTTTPETHDGHHDEMFEVYNPRVHLKLFTTDNFLFGQKTGRVAGGYAGNYSPLMQSARNGQCK